MKSIRYRVSVNALSRGLGALCLVALCLVAPRPAQAQVIKLDFGTDKSPLRKGFLRVTHETLFAEGVVAGWTKKGEMVSKSIPIKREWTYSESSGRSSPPPMYATDLTCDHVESKAPAMLRVKVADGQHHVWLLCGQAGGNRYQVWNLVAFSGRYLAGFAGATFAGGQESRVLELSAAAVEGHLDIRFSSGSRWLVNAAVIVPEAEWQATKKSLIAAIEKETFVLPDDVLKKWQHLPHEDKTPMPEFTNEEKKRGLVVYHRSYLEPIWPNTVPRRKDFSPPLRAFASRDEYEPLTFTVFPLKDFEGLYIDVSDLVASSGDTISRDDIDVRYVRYMHVRPNYRTFGTYYRAPDVLMPMESRRLIKGENFRVWITVYVGPGAKDGVYRGRAEICPGGFLDDPPVATVPILLRVLPIRLQKNRSLVYGQYYRHPYGAMTGAPDVFSRLWWRRKAEMEHADMAAHGNNTVVLGLGGRQGPDGRWRFDYDRLGMAIDLYRKHGFYQPIICHFPAGSLYRKYMKASMGSHLRLIKMPPKAFFQELTEMVRTIEAERRRRQWPELLYYPVDEPSRSGVAVEFMAQVMKAIKRVPGVRTYVTADPIHEQFAPMKPYVDVWCCQPFSLDRDTILADMKKRGVEYWCYPNHIAGENDHTPVAGSRMTYGFGFWRSGFRALTPWIYQAIIGDQWNYLDGSAMDFFNRTDDDASPIPVMMWEAYREGIDDGRYITTLDRWIERAKQAGLADLVKEAEADRQLVWDSVNVLPKYKHDGLWDPDVFDVYRWILANQILILQAAVEG